MIRSYSSNTEQLICFFTTDVNVQVTHGFIDLDFKLLPAFVETKLFYQEIFFWPVALFRLYSFDSAREQMLSFFTSHSKLTLLPFFD